MDPLEKWYTCPFAKCRGKLRTTEYYYICPKCGSVWKKR